ncbi:hypothetical protein M0Q50_07970 [bacterium]|jgi:hypothetical protein|nr:hypothetical protein [bacterium]
MKIKLIKEEILNNLYSEEDLRDLSIMESIYSIRKLKALADSLDGEYILVSDDIKNGQVFSHKYQIWFLENEYITL